MNKVIIYTLSDPPMYGDSDYKKKRWKDFL